MVLDTGRKIREHPRLSQLAADTGLTIRHIAAAADLSPDPTACLDALRPLNERLLVMTRPASDGAMASAIAAARQVPVLVIEPEGLTPGAPSAVTPR